MKTKHSRQGIRGQRGAAAVEFALVLPMFLCALGLVMNTGIAFFARYQLTNFTSSAARYCVSQVNMPASQLDTCARAYMNSVDISVLEGLCHNITAQTVISAGPGSNPKMNVLEVQVTCNALWVTLANAMPGRSIDALQLTVKSAMPFSI